MTTEIVRRSESVATAPPVALTIAGSDSSAGAGIQADLKTFAAHGIYGLSAVTCVVAETPGKVVRIDPLSAAAVRAQIDVLVTSFPVRAVKTGLLCSVEVVREVARAFHGTELPLVIDPVMVATSGDVLLQREAIACYEADLFPLAALVTPNLDEAATLLSRKIATVTEMREAGRELTHRYRVPFLLKGGHLSGEHAIDLLFAGEEVTEFHAPFTRGVATHGTGCTYSAAITAGLSAGLALHDAIQRAKDFVTRAIAQHFTWSSARGDIHTLNHRPNES